MEFASQTFLYLIFIAAYFIFALFKMKWAVLALPLFFSAYLLSFTIAGIPFTVVEGLVYVTFIAFIGHAILNKFFVQKIILHDKIWLPVVLLLFASIISVLIVPGEILLIDGKTVFASQKIALGILKGWIVAPILALALFYAVLGTAKDMRMLLNFYVFSSLFLALCALYQVLDGHYITTDMRASGPFISANYLALYITPAVFYVFAYLSRTGSFVFSLILVILVVALLFTKSYAAILALMFAVMCYLALQHRLFFRKRLYLGFIGLVLSVILIIIFLNPVKWQMFTVITERTSSSVRLEVYRTALRLIAEHPFLGVGLGQFPALYQLEAPRILGHAPYEWNMLHPHNIFLAFWLNLGLAGLISLLWILALCTRKIWSLLKMFSEKSAANFDSFVCIKIIAFFMLFIIIFHGFFDTPFFKNDLALLFWLVVAVILSSSSSHNVKNI